MKLYKIKDNETNKIFNWTLDEVLEVINRDRDENEEWEDVTENDDVEAHFKSLVEPEGYLSIL